MSQVLVIEMETEIYIKSLLLPGKIFQKNSRFTLCLIRYVILLRDTVRSQVQQQCLPHNSRCFPESLVGSKSQGPEHNLVCVISLVLHVWEVLTRLWILRVCGTMFAECICEWSQSSSSDESKIQGWEVVVTGARVFKPSGFGRIRMLYVTLTKCHFCVAQKEMTGSQDLRKLQLG